MKLSVLFLCAAAAHAQVAVQKPVQPSKFVEAVGRRAALLGREDGRFEAWVFPIKVLRDFRLSAYVDNALEPVPLAEWAETVEVHPGHVTVTYAHAAFTVRQTLVAPIEEPAAAVLLDIDTSRPLRLRASFIPEMKPMWPASFGGQSTSWNARDGVLSFTEGLRRFRPVIGCPLFSRISEQVGHQLPDRTVMIEFEVTPESARRGPVPLVIAGSREIYDRLLPRAAALPAEAARYYQAFQERTLAVSADPFLQGPFLWAKFALEKGWACNDGVGCGLVAGWGESGLSERPGFGWYFGGDALMNAWAILDYGDFERVRGILDFLRRHQREDGKMPHELTQSLALLDWSQYPYGYYHADTTPLYLFTAARYIRMSGDREFLVSAWPSLEKAYRLCLTAVDPDGLLSNAKFGAAAVETGALSGKVAKDVYLAGVWIAALNAYAEMAGWMGKEAERADAEQRLEKARASAAAWFLPDKGFFAFAELKDGTRYEANSGWQGFLLAHGGLRGGAPALAARALSRPELATDWGTRLFATDSPFYDPLSYNDGSVWPFVTAFAAMAEYRHGQSTAGFLRLAGLAGATGLAGAGFIGEYFSGDRFQLLPRSVPHQLFSSMAMIHPLVSGMLGLEGDAMAGRLRFAPQVPRLLGRVAFERYRVGRAVVSGEVERSENAVAMALRVEGAPLDVLFESDAETQSARLSPGQPVRVTLPAAPDRAQPAAPWPLSPGSRSRWPRLKP
jgi:glycogen debranching enzyme